MQLLIINKLSSFLGTIYLMASFLNYKSNSLSSQTAVNFNFPKMLLN